MRIKQEHKVVIITILAGVSLWLMDAFLDKIDKYPEEPFLRVLLLDTNGQGFNLEEILGQENRTKGTGIATMIERARLAGGQLEINSRVGAGTEITFMIPVRVEREVENGNL